MELQFTMNTIMTVKMLFTEHININFYNSGHLVLTSYNNTYLKYYCYFSPSETQQWVQKVSVACWCHLHLTLQFTTHWPLYLTGTTSN